MPDRRIDTATRERVLELEERYRRVARRLTYAVAIIGITLVVLTAISVGLIRANADRADQIQQQRTDSIRTACEEQNARHDGSLDALVKGAAVDEAARKTAAGKREVRRRRDVTIALLDALAPPQDCEALIRESVQMVK